MLTDCSDSHRLTAHQGEVAAWEAGCRALRQRRADAREAEAAARAALASAQTQQVRLKPVQIRFMQRPCCWEQQTISVCIPPTT